MIRDQTKEVIKKIMSLYPGFKPNNLSETIDEWQKVLAEFPESVIKGNLDKYIASDKGIYPPNVSNLIPHQKETYGFKGRIYTSDFFDEIEKEVDDNGGVY